jgi:Bifunctional DNA primase/polymerase, N-terminal/AAA domain
VTGPPNGKVPAQGGRRDSSPTQGDQLDQDLDLALQRTALELAQRFHVFPLDHPSHEWCQGVGKDHKPHKDGERGKHPACKWSDWSTQDTDKTARYFGGRAFNIGIDCGKSGILVVDEDTMGEWEQVCAFLGIDPPRTFTVRTSKGRHFYFLQPAGVPLGNRDRALKAAGFNMNIRGKGGFVVGSGSLHETGVIYEVIDDSDLAVAPAELVDKLRAKPSGNGSPVTRMSGDDRGWWREGAIAEGDRHNAIVAAAGWCLAMPLTIAEARPIVREVLSRCQGAKYTLDDAYGRLDDVYGRYETGDRLEQRRETDEDEERDADTWTPVDLTDAVHGRKVRQPPTILKRSDGRYLFYEGQINYLHGTDGVGKSYVALFAATGVLDEGGHVVWLDWEDPDEVTIVGRLLDLGVAPDVILGRFHYHHPETDATKAAVAKIVDLVRNHNARLVVVDSIGEAFGVEGIGENNDDEVAPWIRRVLRPLAATGAGVLPIDHSIKSGDNPLHPSGSKRKRATVTGSHFLVDATRPISKEYAGGELRLTCAKDRHGNYTRGKVAAKIEIAIYPDGGWTVHVHPPIAATDEAANNDRVLAAAMVRLVRDLEKEMGAKPTLTQIEQSKRVKGGVQAKRAAVEYGAACGSLSEAEGPRKARLFSYVRDLNLTPSDPVTTPSDGDAIRSAPTPSPRPLLEGRGQGRGQGTSGTETETPTPSDGVNTTWLTDLVAGEAYQRSQAKARAALTGQPVEDPR